MNHKLKPSIYQIFMSILINMHIIVLPYSTLSSPPKTTVTLPKSEGTRQRLFFIFTKSTFKILGIKNFSQSNFLICYEYINNNSYINLDDGNRIRIIWSCSNAVKTHAMFCIFHKNFANWKTNWQNFNQIYSNSLE